MFVRLLRERATQNFGVSFSIISILTGIPPMFFFGLVSIHQRDRLLCSLMDLQTTGGPAVMVWGFIVVGRDSSSRFRVSDLPSVK
jgi:hypothetical protein